MRILITFCYNTSGQNMYMCMFGVACSKKKKQKKTGNFFFIIFSMQIYKEHLVKESNFNTLKSLTQKLNHLNHIKWHKRYKSDFFVERYKKLLYLKKHKGFKTFFNTFLQILAKKFIVGTFQQGRSGNCKQTYFFLGLIETSSNVNETSEKYMLVQQLWEVLEFYSKSLEKMDT